jgi:Probable lipoprotein LpqN
MKRMTAINGVAIAIMALGIGLVGCGGSTSSNNASSKTSASTSTGATTSTANPQSKVAPRTSVPGPNPTIASYIQQNNITQTPVHRGDPGAPTINLPIPDGWADAGPDTPATAYWAVVDNGPEAAKYTPSIVATLSKLVGDVDPQKILDNSPGELKNLPGFKPMGDGSDDSLADNPAHEFGGTWVQDGQTKAVAEKTVVIQGPDDNTVYLLQLNIDCLADQIDKVLPATMVIDDKTTIAK